MVFEFIVEGKAKVGVLFKMFLSGGIRNGLYFFVLIFLVGILLCDFNLTRNRNVFVCLGIGNWIDEFIVFYFVLECVIYLIFYC